MALLSWPLCPVHSTLAPLSRPLFPLTICPGHLSWHFIPGRSVLAALIWLLCDCPYFPFFFYLSHIAPYTLCPVHSVHSVPGPCPADLRHTLRLRRGCGQIRGAVTALTIALTCIHCIAPHCSYLQYTATNCSSLHSAHFCDLCELHCTVIYYCTILH